MADLTWVVFADRHFAELGLLALVLILAWQTRRRR